MDSVVVAYIILLFSVTFVTVLCIVACTIVYLTVQQKISPRCIACCCCTDRAVFDDGNEAGSVLVRGYSTNPTGI